MQIKSECQTFLDHLASLTCFTSNVGSSLERSNLGYRTHALDAIIVVGLRNKRTLIESHRMNAKLSHRVQRATVLPRITTCTPARRSPAHCHMSSLIATVSPENVGAANRARGQHTHFPKQISPRALTSIPRSAAKFNMACTAVKWFARSYVRPFVVRENEQSTSAPWGEDPIFWSCRQ